MAEADEPNLKPQEAFYKWLEIWTPMIERFKTFKWKGEDGEQMWHFLRRGVIVRQFEALQAIQHLIEGGRGNFGVVFLRPAFEELVWIEYLTKHIDIANELIGRMANIEIAANIKAQDDYVGRREMIEGGFTTELVKTLLDGDQWVQSRIREIGTKLGWNMSRSLLPTMAYLAKQVDREKDYKFLYQGTSRYVHFSTQEIFRRIWGTKGDVTITSKNFNEYWEQFGISWGVRIFADLIIACIDDFGEYADGLTESIGEIGQLQAMFAGTIPIITLGELRGWRQ